MILSSEDAVDIASLNPAICIVGAGAAGITLACELDGSGIDVLLVEAGGRKLDLAASQKQYQGTSTSAHPSPAEYRRTGFGGTTCIWGGRCVPLDPIDFERRDYVPHSGWPIAYEEVARHYPKALEYCEAGRFDFSTSTSLPWPTPTIPGLENQHAILADRIERYSLPTHFGVSHRAQLHKSVNVKVLLHARCICLNRRAGAHAIESIEIVDHAARRRTLTAKVFVLAMGGIETTRLLLASDPAGKGLGNSTDRLGRFYACHFESICAKVVSNGAKLAFDFERTLDGIYCRRKLQFSAEAQREHRLLNGAFRLHFPDYSDASHRSAALSTIYLAKSTVIAEYRNILQHGNRDVIASPTSAHLRNIIFGLPQLMVFAYDWLFRRVLAHRKLPYTLIQNADGSYPLEFNSEQTPLESSRITLGDERDEHGVPRVHIDWRISDDDIEAARRAFLLLREEINRTPNCRMEFDETQLSSALRASVPVGGHHIGTTRMAASAADGVVDRNCAVFDAPNLYIASASVFPTSSHANPTLTIVAMAIRLASHLKNVLAPQRINL